MARTTPTDVRAIIDTHLTDPEITVIIDMASRFVDSVFANCGLSEETLKDLETYLTAHMIASTRDRQAIEESAGTAQIKYTGKFGEGLYSTTYGQMAIMLDTCGVLVNTGKRVAKMKAVVSTYPSYVNRGE